MQHDLSSINFNVTEKKLLKNENTAPKILGLPVPSLSEITERAVLRKARPVSSDSYHLMYDEFKLLPSARRFRTMKCVKNKFKYSFIPTAIR